MRSKCDTETSSSTTASQREERIHDPLFLLSQLQSGGFSQTESTTSELSHENVGANRSTTGEAAGTALIACCNSLSTALPGKVLTQGTIYNSQAFNRQLSFFWALQNRDIQPSCFVQPNSTQDVSTIMKTISAANIGTGKCPFAIRSGGHSPIPTANNIADGVTIDLSGLNQINLWSDESVVRVGPGNRWGDIFAKLDLKNLGVVAGRVANVGVGGLLTGGGISFFTPRYGFVCDNVVNFQVVLASGEIVNANSLANSDLFRALKGGSGNFGIVTRFDLKTFEQGPYYGGLAILNTTFVDSDRPKMMSWYEGLIRTGDPYAHVILTFNSMGILGTPMTIGTANFQYTKNEAKPAILQPMLQTAIYNTGRISNTTSFSQELKVLSGEGRRQLFMSFTFKNSASFMETVYQISKQQFDIAYAVTSGLQWSLSFQHLSKGTLAKAKSEGGNSLGLENAPDTTLALLTVAYNSASHDNVVEKAARDLFEEAQRKANDAGVFSRFIYLNYAAKFQNPIRAYGTESNERMVGVSLKYDPNGIFQRFQPGGFKIASFTQKIVPGPPTATIVNKYIGAGNEQKGT
ncbi:FAD-binding domain-containing protein [Microthyrium microscopicum]|uniref:FAD-binding domain-containing protein n=1 Tax=Microthyrium microscopicum TaxID=703497 RepID=A0A6A6U8P9_9PEZI|nr:FAD-binding domain-containing protein [Microthyrium microscopicum]